MSNGVSDWHFVLCTLCSRKEGDTLLGLVTENAANAAIVGATSCVGAAPPAADALAATLARRAVAAVYAAALNRLTLLVI